MSSVFADIIDAWYRAAWPCLQWHIVWDTAPQAQSMHVPVCNSRILELCVKQSIPKDTES